MTASQRLGLGYAVVFGLLLLAALNPVLPWGRAPLDLVILLDDSLSMGGGSGTDWARITTAAGRLPADSRVSLVRFAGDAVREIDAATPAESGLDPEAPPRRQALDRTASDIENALNQALRLTLPGRDALFLLVSDGRETQGEARRALQAAKQAGVRVLGLGTKENAHAHGVWIEDLAAPTRARRGMRIPVTATLAGAAGGEGRLQLLVDGVPRDEATLALHAGQSRQHRFWLSLDQAGPHLLTLRVQGPDAAADTRQTVVNVQGPLPWLYVTQRPAPLAQSLLAGGHPLEVIAPHEFPRDEAALGAVSGVVLDDIAIDAMADSAWLALARAVRGQGLGLIVLGGPHAFGGGGYRRSVLEGLLPVTAESREARPPAAVLFVVDKSGSMDRDPSGVSRIALARQAVMHTARALPDGDRVGLLAFDVDAAELLPLAARPDPVAALQQAWRIAPSGGTRLGPALALAIDRLAAGDAGQRLLVVLSDGFVGHDDLRPLREKMAVSGIDLIALAIGSEVETSVLKPLTTINRGRLVPVRHLARLPRLMREAVEERRNPAEAGGTPVVVQIPLPYLSGADRWPGLSAYMVTKARPGATVYLRSARGDPLLAMQQAGAGRVVALPGGLGPWAASWFAWRDWARFAGGLTAWTAGNNPDSRLHLAVSDGPGYLAFDIDTQASGENSGSAQLVIQDPLSRSTELTLEPVAPGRYQARWPVQQTGRYRIGLRVGGQRLRHELIHAGDAELASRFSPLDPYPAWREAGLIEPWAAGEDRLPGGQTRSGLQTRPAALLLAVLSYLGLIARERGLNGRTTLAGLARLLHRLRGLTARFSKRAAREGG